MLNEQWKVCLIDLFGIQESLIISMDFRSSLLADMFILYFFCYVYLNEYQKP